MGTTWGEKYIKAKRKPSQCVWCNERIEVGQPASKWAWQDGRDITFNEAHPECAEAIQRAAAEEGGYFEFMPGENERGKWGDSCQ